MFPGFSPKKMQAVMKQMGMRQENIEADRVIIEKKDGTNLVFHNPEIIRIIIQGQESYQINGQSVEETGESKICQEDINTVVEKTGCAEEQAEKVLESVKGDLAEAILELSE